MENKARYTLVGLFVLSFAIASVIFILWLARYDIDEINAKEFRLYSTSSIAGLNENSIVEYKGLDIGTIKKIKINPNNLEQIEIILKISKPDIIKENSYAIIQSQGVTGNKTIEISGGTQDAKVLEVNENSFAVLPLKKSFIDKITSSAGNISSQIELLLKKFDTLLNEGNIKNIDGILENTHKSSQNFNQMMLKVNNLLENNLIKTLNNLDNMTSSIDTVVKKDIKNTVNRIDSMTKNIDLLGNDIKTLVNNDVKLLINDLRQTANSSKDIDLVLDQLENTLKQIDITVEEFNQNSGNMIFNTREIKYGPGEKQ